MKLDKIIYASFAGMMLAGCTQEVVPGIEPTPGKDVVFGTKLEDAKNTRTIYGNPNTDTNGNPTSYPIEWVHGDQVKVYSPECRIQEGTYQVEYEHATGQGSEAQELVKVSDAGVQWGDNPTGNFYSIYPAQRVNSFNMTTRTANCWFDHNQNDYLYNNGTTYTARAHMESCFLYATTPNAQNGRPVNLTYSPISTAVRFTLRGPKSGDAVQIRQVIFRGPKDQALAGDFTLTFPEDGGVPTITPTTDVDNNEHGFNEIRITAPYAPGQGSGYLTLGVNQSIELNAFILLNKATELTDDWQIELILPDNTSVYKRLGNTTIAATNKTLQPGKINRLPVDALPTLDLNRGDYDPSNWMVNIPRNTYLSEISIPGSWNSLNSDFQYGTFNLTAEDGSTSTAAGTDLDAQYNAGCRAFHLDARWINTETLGVAAGGGTRASGSGWDTSGGNQVTTNTNTFQSFLKTITDKVKPDEYMVVFCTFAQNSAVPTGKSWEKQISDACTALGDKIADASQINYKSVVYDVLGKVIVIVNTEGTIPTIANSKCFFVNAPLTLKQGMFGSSIQDSNKDLLHYGSGNGSPEITLYTSQCQVQAQSQYTQGSDSDSRGYLPTQTQRTTLLNAILDWSKDNYANKTNYTTKNWIYLGLGGYRGYYLAGNVNAIGGSYSTIASTYNGWINNRVTNMNATPTGNQTGFYPVGIVLMNDVAGYTNVFNNILQLNNRMPLEYDSSRPAWPKDENTDGQNSIQRKKFAALAERGGDAWEVR